MPERVDGVDPGAFPLTPMEYFIYSRVDGVLDVGALGEACGLSSADVGAAVLSLSGHGLVALGGASASPQRPRERHEHSPDSTQTPDPAPTPAHTTVHTKPPPPGTSRALYDPAELEEEDVALDAERRRQVLDTFYRLEELDHYALLEVERDAEKRQIRDAYFALAKVFHPDTRFGKELGSYKSKMEVVFKYITDAYEVLSKKKPRREYDAYLGFKSETEGAQRQMEVAQGKAEAIERGEELPPSDPPPEPAPPRAPAPAHHKPDARARKAYMARQIAAATGRGGKGSSRPPRKAQSSVPPTASKAQRLKGLRRSLRGAAALRGATDDIKARQLEAAAEAESRKDWVGMANALRLALAADPNDAELLERHASIKKRVAKQLADSYEQQARYEEDHTNWQAAARSWKRVAAGREGDYRPLVSAARALLTAKTELHEARDLAQEAKGLAPKKIAPLIALAEIYIQIDLKKNARRELLAAQKLDPKSEIVKNLLRTLKG
ncbi:MAG: DnaJ domain-containing protein [Deltaproteobacteria bacterium]|nr:DnaJ domain-containing protein [Deltaproteobacteria bacterium]